MCESVCVCECVSVCEKVDWPRRAACRQFPNVFLGDTACSSEEHTTPFILYQPTNRPTNIKHINYGPHQHPWGTPSSHATYIQVATTTTTTRQRRQRLRMQAGLASLRLSFVRLFVLLPSVSAVGTLTPDCTPGD